MNPIRSDRHSRLRVLMLASIILPVLAIPSVILPAHAAGTLYVSPANMTTQPAGTMLTYLVKVASIDSFNGWDISVQTDPNVLDPVSLTVTGNLFEINFSTSVIEVVNCVDGVGTGCSINDRPGVAHSSAVSGGASTTSGTNGLLFTITYQVLNPGSSLLAIPPGLDLIFNGGASVSHTSSPGVYGTPPFFTVDANPASLTLQASSSGTSTITLNSVNGFADIVNLTASILPVMTGSPSALLNNSTVTAPSVNVTLTAGGTGSATLNIGTTASTPLGAYTVTVTGVNGPLQQSALVSVNIVAPPDFSLSGSPTILPIRIGHSGTFVLTLMSLNGFTGNVMLSVTAPSSFGTSFSVNPVSLSPSGSATSMLTISIPHGTHKGTFTITVTAVAGSLVHTVTLTVMAEHHIAATSTVTT